MATYTYPANLYQGWGPVEAQADWNAKNGGNASSGSVADTAFGNYTNLLNKFNSASDEYINGLLNIAQGDYDFVAKYIEGEYKTALGTDDVAKQDFLKEVANDLEKKVGTIAYDYQTGKYRTTQDKTIALQRLAQDEVSAKRVNQQENTQLLKSGATALNERGLVTGAIPKTEGLGAGVIGDIQNTIQNKTEALQRQFSRGNEDVNLSSGRNLEDLTTTARRGANTAEVGYQQKTEEAKRALIRAKAQAEAERKKNQLTALQGADYFASSNAFG